MVQRSSVLGETEEVTQAEFRAAMLDDLSRCANTPAKKRALASAMDLSSNGLDNILLHDTMPGAKRLWDATLACRHALDSVAARYGFELVRKDDAGSAAAPGTAPMAQLLAQVAAAEAPDSDGGTAMTHQELLAMEADIRRVHALTAQWLKQITDLRTPRAING